jgi:type III secretion system-like peptide-binding chaperone
MRIEGTLQDIAEWLEVKLDAVRTTGDEFVIVECGPYYTQLLCNRDVIYGEMVSNTYLGSAPGGVALSPDDEARLVDLGWNRPDSPCHSLCEREHSNFHRLWSCETPTADVVHDMLLPLISVGIHQEGERFAIIWDLRANEASTGLPTRH